MAGSTIMSKKVSPERNAHLIALELRNLQVFIDSTYDDLSRLSLSVDDRHRVKSDILEILSEFMYKISRL